MLPRLFAITDLGRATEDEHLAAYAHLIGLLPSGMVAIQVRAHGETARRVLAFAARLRDRFSGAWLVVNDRLDVAKALGVSRVHLGERSVDEAAARAFLGEGAWISRAVHAPTWSNDGADAVLLSPIFATPGKGAPLGLDVLRAFVATHDVPVYALGGVDAPSARACIAAGATGVAAIRACLDRREHEALARALLEASNAVD